MLMWRTFWTFPFWENEVTRFRKSSLKFSKSCIKLISDHFHFEPSLVSSKMLNRSLKIYQTGWCFILSSRNCPVFLTVFLEWFGYVFYAIILFMYKDDVSNHCNRPDFCLITSQLTADQATDCWFIVQLYLALLLIKYFILCGTWSFNLR